MGGLDLLVALTGRAADAGFPMVVLTSSSAPADAIRSKLRSATRVVTKPRTVMELYAVLTTTIEAVCPSGPGVAHDRPNKAPGYLKMANPRGVRRGPS